MSNFASELDNAMKLKNIVIATVLLPLTAAAEIIQKDSLLAEVQRRDSLLTTSYVISREALDANHLTSLKDIVTLLPGGKTSNATLTDDSRLSLRSMPGERGYASFGTVVEIDGMRLSSNGMMTETLGPSLRSISTFDVESVEVITGIPSVEYGDLSNGIVRIKRRSGATPFLFEVTATPHTYLIAANKGLRLQRHAEDGTTKDYGVLTLSAEHARSHKAEAMPHPDFMRNVLSARYQKALEFKGTSLDLRAGVTGNIGTVNMLLANLDVNWIYHDKKIGDINIDVHGDIITSDVHNDFIRCQKPTTWKIKGKGTFTTHRWGERKTNCNRFMLGIEYSNTGNSNSLMPLPSVSNTSHFVADKLTIGGLNLELGYRDDITTVKDRLTLGALSPRANILYNFFTDRKGWISDLAIHAGWGESAKLPSYQVLYPVYIVEPIEEKELRWQMTSKVDMGIETRIRNAKVHLSAYYHRTANPYEIAKTEQGYVFINGAAVKRYGIEWILDSPLLHFASSKKEAGDMTLRMDGNYYHMHSNNQCNLNATLISRFPTIGLLAMVRMESSLLRYDNPLMEWSVPAYCSANVMVEKELGRWLTASIYANNIFNTLHGGNYAQPGLDMPFLNAPYRPSFNCGFSLKVSF